MQALHPVFQTALRPFAPAMSDAQEEIERMKKIVEYNPRTGVFTRLVAAGGRKVGDVCGWTMSRGYTNVSVGGRQVFAHRLAWMFMHGPIPEKMDIDHIDGNRQNNRILNLRLATRSQNNQNMRTAKSNNASGLLGVHHYKRTGKFTAQIAVNGQSTHLGYFDTAEEAHLAYLKAKGELHEFAPSNAAVSVRQTRYASTYEWEYRGSDREAVQQAAQNRASGIDAYRSPAVSMSRLDGDEWVYTLRYYTCD